MPQTAHAPLMSLDDALGTLLAQAVPLDGDEVVGLAQADGRVLARDLLSEMDVPPHDNSAMDGYAVRCADAAVAGAQLPVSQRIAAGDAPVALAAGTAARIFTGAPIPSGADAVVMQEDAEALDGGGRVRLRAVPVAGQNVRRAGEDVAAGSAVLRRGQRLGPAALGLAASIGAAQLAVARRPRVALFCTGSELVEPGSVPPARMPAGAIYNSNRHFLAALLRRLGCEVSDMGTVPDDAQATRRALAQAARGHDVVLSSGGVSVGEEDHVKPAVEALGALRLWSVAIKPGKPFAFGHIRREQGEGADAGLDGPADAGAAHFIGLPGNPVSGYVTFLLLVRPFLLRLMGVGDVAVPVQHAPAAFDWPRAGKRREFLRVRRNAQGALQAFGSQGSGVLTSMHWADGLADVPAGATVAAGDMVRFWPLADMF